MSEIAYQHFDPLLPAPQAEEMLRLCERFSRYGSYAEQSIDDDFGEGITQRHEGFHEAARKIHDRPIVEPNIVYANILVPGQELAVHSDDLTRKQLLDTLVADLRRRGRVGHTLPDDTQLALTIIDEYIKDPPPAPGDALD